MPGEPGQDIYFTGILVLNTHTHTQIEEKEKEKHLVFPIIIWLADFACCDWSIPGP